MTPKQFTDIYPVGTKIHFDLKRYDLNYAHWPDGVCTYLGTTHCDCGDTCDGDCDGMMKLQTPDLKISKHCMCFNAEPLEGEMPIGIYGVLPNFIKDEDFEL